MSRAPRLMLAATAVAMFSACMLEPDVGPPLAGVCRDGDYDPEVSISFSMHLRPVIARQQGGCSCHLPTSAGPGPATQLSGLDLSSFASLRAGGLASGARIIVPGEPCASIMFQKASEAPPFGSRMPLGGPFLTAEEQRVLHDWIAEGALDN